MILIGQYDSPFVRRVGIALTLYGFPFEHRPWSTFGDADKIAPYNPLRRVPTLVLDDGEVLIESAAILDHLDECAGPDAALIAERGPERRTALRLCALATGLCDKLVALIYERVLHEAISPLWVRRCETQVHAVLDRLDAELSAGTGPFVVGHSIGHADIALACAMGFLKEAHPGLAKPDRWPTLFAGAARCEAMPPFQTIVQTFIPPAR